VESACRTNASLRAPEKQKGLRRAFPLQQKEAGLSHP
jgi:hypothetical protein